MKHEKTRREFLKLGILAAGAGALVGVSLLKVGDGSTHQLEQINEEFESAVRKPRFP